MISHISGRCTNRAMGAFGLMLFAGTAHAQDEAIQAIWEEPLGGAWSDAGRWSTPVSPNNTESETYDAFITVGGEEPYTIDLDIDVTLRDFAVTTNARLRIAGTSLRVDRNLTLAGGAEISGDGESSAALSASGNVIISDSTVARLDALDFDGDAVISGTSLTDIAMFRTGEDRVTALANVFIDRTNVESRGDLLITGGGLLREGATSLTLCDTCVDHGDGVIRWNANTSVSLMGNSDLNIMAGGSLDASDDSGGSIMGEGNGLQNFTNEGTVNVGTVASKKNKDGRVADVSITGLNFNNLGEVRVNSGQLSVDGLQNLVEGDLVGGTYTVLDTGSLNLVGESIFRLDARVNLVGVESTFAALDGIFEIGTQGTLSLQGGRDFNTIEGLTNDGTVEIGAGSVLDVTSAGLFNIVEGELVGGTYVVEGGIRNLVDFGEFIDGQIFELSSDVTLIGEESVFDGLTTLQRVGSAGQFKLEGGRTFETEGSLDVAEGAFIRIGAASTLQVNGFLGNFNEGLFDAASFEIAGTLIAQNAAIEEISNELILDGTESIILDLQGNDALEQIRRINADGILRLRNGRRLQTVGNLEVAGILSVDPGPGFPPFTKAIDGAQLEVAADLIVGEDATIALSLLGTEPDSFGDIFVGDQLLFGDDGVAGTLQLVIGPEFDAAFGTEILLIEAGSVEGVFESVEIITIAASPLGVSDPFEFQIFYTATGVGARVIPTPGALAFALPGLLLAARRRRS